ncbi:E3 ubiquitin-protein ligase COP1 [Exaiptasia diaphana]|uniref:RING-type domain-containing protein n=1 Tax=Exaiptasia diaphana TaxID=2652724 RepID=A0A913YW56_EXADI|nr:E3 ubiquitin-protein ligase COP1 [Exaiptasia diaphana]
MARDLGSSSSSQRGGGRRRGNKRPHPPIYGGITNSFSDRNSDFLCPICFDTIDEAFMTKCGHTFCYQCINRSLSESNRCPKCNFIIEKADQIFPNFLCKEFKERRIIFSVNIDDLSKQEFSKS